jgi:hypothetical protein
LVVLNDFIVFRYLHFTFTITLRVPLLPSHRLALQKVIVSSGK